MSWIDDLFGGGREKAGNDMYKQMMQAWQNAQGLMNPYIQEGNDPAALYNKYAASYKESPEALAQVQVGQKNANNAAAASGMLGSGAEQTNAANLAQSVRSEDFDKYMGNLYATHNQGFNASNNLSSMMQKLFEDMAQAKGGRDMGRAGGLEGLLSGGLGLAGSLFGGPMGGMGGSMLGNYLFGGGMGNSGDPHSSDWQDPDLQQPF
jgi:hypothetical protein